MTVVYKIEKDGEIKELATYSLESKEALKAAYLQFIKNNYNTWDYDNYGVEIEEGSSGYHILLNDNESLYVKK